MNIEAQILAMTFFLLCTIYTHDNTNKLIHTKVERADTVESLFLSGFFIFK